ncbi:MAG: restriction endonuclease subunit S [Thermoguttaceae bacterium]|nr:restriction endonuclease subunit S [Thermoguttaceae bacterium]
MTPQELRNSILQLAIQGKLVEQNKNEGISLKGEVWEDEIFPIPDNWIWKRFGFFANIRMGKTILKKDLFDEGIPVYSATQSDTVLGYVKCAELELHKDDLVIPARGNSIGYVTLVKDEVATCTQTTICATKLHDILPEYLYYCCYAFKPIWFVYSGSAIPQITVNQISNCMVPLPPLPEQKRIVAKIEELLPYIDRYEVAWTRLGELDKQFPGDLQKSVLQLAIQGKLVEQRPDEGTAEELYREIQREKQRLVKEGKIKKEKPLPEIKEDEIPFEIPDGWKWVRLPSIAQMCLGKMLDKQKNTGTFCQYLRNVNVRWGSFDLSDLLEMRFEDVVDPRFLIEKNDLVMCEGGEPGRCAVWTSEKPFHFQKALHRIRFWNKLNPFFFFHLFKYYADSGMINDFFTGSTIKHLTGQALEKFIVPLPPLSEQKRIVAKIEELLPLCERLTQINALS